MPNNVNININPISSPTPTKTAQFAPSPQTALANDLIYWTNNDTKASHQPMPVGGPANKWVTQPVVAKDPNDTMGLGTYTTNTVSFLSGTTKQGIPYTCALHPGEQGTLVVLNYVNITPNPGASTTDPQILFNGGNPTTVKVNEAFIFTNGDSNYDNSPAKHEHWPMPSGGDKRAWVQSAIQPGYSSPPISVAQPTVTDGLTYECALHPDETGTLVVAVNIDINGNANTGAPAVFAPNPQTVGVNQAFIFTNNDIQPHQPMPSGGTEDEWTGPISPGQPSGPISISAASSGINYVCALHANEKGVLIVK